MSNFFKQRMDVSGRSLGAVAVDSNMLSVGDPLTLSSDELRKSYGTHASCSMKTYDGSGLYEAFEMVVGDERFFAVRINAKVNNNGENENE